MCGFFLGHYIPSLARLPRESTHDAPLGHAIMPAPLPAEPCISALRPVGDSSFRHALAIRTLPGPFISTSGVILPLCYWPLSLSFWVWLFLCGAPISSLRARHPRPVTLACRRC